MAVHGAKIAPIKPIEKRMFSKCSIIFFRSDVGAKRSKSLKTQSVIYPIAAAALDKNILVSPYRNMDLDTRYPGLLDLKRAAKRKLPYFVWEYLDSATGTESVLVNNRAAFDLSLIHI